MIQKMALSIKTTSACQNRCEFCPVVPWMDNKKGWETDLDNIVDLVKYSDAAGYHWEKIIFSGGEPLLWTWLEIAAVLIRESGITDKLFMYTNALQVTDPYLPEFKDICKNFDSVIISLYDNNLDNYKLARSVKNVRAIARDKYYKVPVNPVDGSLPANCGCMAFGMVGDKITLCSFQDHLVAYKGWMDHPAEICTLGPDFLKPFENVDPFTRDMCRYCYGNLNARGGISTYG